MDAELVRRAGNAAVEEPRQTRHNRVAVGEHREQRGRVGDVHLARIEAPLLHR